jgi:hypothetical protein
MRMRTVRLAGTGAVVGTMLLGSVLVACGATEEARTSDAMAPGSPGVADSYTTTPAIVPAPGVAPEATKQLVAPSNGEAATRSAAAPVPASGAPAASNGGAPAEPNLPSLDFLGRSIIRTGSMELLVEAVPDAFERVSAIAAGAGGFVAESRFFGRATAPTVAPRTAVPGGTDGREPAAATAIVMPPRGGASLTLRVPADRFDDVVAQLRGVATEVRTISTGSQDVTGQVTDLESTIRNLRAVEARYMEMLNSARTLSEILQVQDRLNQTRDQIERAQGRLASLRRMADMSTLTVTLTPAPVKAETPKPASPLAPVGEAWDASLEALRGLGVALLVGAAFGWWMLPLLALALWGTSRVIRAIGGGRGPEPLRPAPIDTPQGTA